MSKKLLETQLKRVW